MTYKVGAKGQVVLPKRLRDELGIEPGDAVSFERERAAIRVRKVSPAEDLWGSLDASEVDPLTELAEAKRRDRAREQSRLREMAH